jgi:hypothetical protein
MSRALYDWGFGYFPEDELQERLARWHTPIPDFMPHMDYVLPPVRYDDFSSSDECGIQSAVRADKAAIRNALLATPVSALASPVPPEGPAPVPEPMRLTEMPAPRSRPLTVPGSSARRPASVDGSSATKRSRCGSPASPVAACSPPVRDAPAPCSSRPDGAPASLMDYTIALYSAHVSGTPPPLPPAQARPNQRPAQHRVALSQPERCDNAAAVPDLSATWLAEPDRLSPQRNSAVSVPPNRLTAQPTINSASRVEPRSSEAALLDWGAVSEDDSADAPVLDRPP